MGKRYDDVEAGEWVQPIRHGYKIACCDCGLVHLMDFRVMSSRTGKLVADARAQFRAFRGVRETAGMRSAKTKGKIRGDNNER